MIPAAACAVSRADLLGWLSSQIARVEPCGDGLASLCLPLPPMAAPVLPPGLPQAWSWVRPDQGVALIGCGEALRHACATPHDLARTVAGLRWRVLDPEGCGAEPAAFLGHAFAATDGAGLPSALVTVPRLLLRCGDGRATLVFSHAGAGDAAAVRRGWLDAAARLLDALDARPAPIGEARVARVAETPSAEEFLARVAAATTAIAAGRIEKVVLSRRVTVQGPRVFDPARLAASLGGCYPSCAVFTASFGARTLVAASPERLVTRTGARVESHALAGTSRRDAADPFLGRRLLASAKDRHEHDLVVRWIVAALAPVSDGLDRPTEPGLMTLGPLQHLWTPVSGTLRPGVGLLDAAARLHPTPAVAGLPLAAAQAVAAGLGEQRAGWYGGALGWIAPSGDGELAVVLRCALLDGNQAHLSTGAGIVGGSAPEAELAETELKLHAMLHSLRVA